MAATITAARWTVTRRAVADTPGRRRSSPCSRAKPAGSRVRARARARPVVGRAAAEQPAQRRAGRCQRRSPPAAPRTARSAHVRPRGPGRAASVREPPASRSPRAGPRRWPASVPARSSPGWSSSQSSSRRRARAGARCSAAPVAGRQQAVELALRIRARHRGRRPAGKVRACREAVTGRLPERPAVHRAAGAGRRLRQRPLPARGGHEAPVPNRTSSVSGR